VTVPAHALVSDFAYGARVSVHEDPCLSSRVFPLRLPVWLPKRFDSAIAREGGCIIGTKARRSPGEGAVFFDAAKGRWIGQLDLGRDTSGRRIRPKVIANTASAARAKLAELRNAHEAGQDVTKRATTFNELVELWMKRGLPSGTTENTRANYDSLLRMHVLPHAGHLKLTILRPEHVESVLDAMAKAGYAGSTIRLTLGLIRRVLGLGERRGLLVRNVAAIVEAPGGPVQQRRGLTREQASALLAAAAKDRLGPLITVSLLLGLRPGEAAGLTWDSVDWADERPTIRVEASLRRTAAGMVLVAPKTPTSRRVLALPGAAVEALQQQREQQERDQTAAGSRWANHTGLVFTTEVGTPLDPSNVRRSLKSVATTAHLGHIHPHLLRHATVSLLSAAGVPLEDISDVLGHRSPTVTADIYRHPISPTRSAHVVAMSALTHESRNAVPPPVA
jgi:integrase